MAGHGPAIHVFSRTLPQDVGSRDKTGHGDFPGIDDLLVSHR